MSVSFLNHAGAASMNSKRDACGSTSNSRAFASRWICLTDSVTKVAMTATATKMPSSSGSETCQNEFRFLRLCSRLPRERTIGKFVAIAHAIGLSFHLTGGSISSAYGEPRLAQDIDIVVSPEVAKMRIDSLVNQMFYSDFLFTERVVRQSVQSGNLFQLLDKTESLKLDIYPRELIPGELQRSPVLYAIVQMRGFFVLTILSQAEVGSATDIRGNV